VQRISNRTCFRATLLYNCNKSNPNNQWWLWFDYSQQLSAKDEPWNSLQSKFIIIQLWQKQSKQSMLTIIWLWPVARCRGEQQNSLQSEYTIIQLQQNQFQHLTVTMICIKWWPSIKWLWGVAISEDKRQDLLQSKFLTWTSLPFSVWDGDKSSKLANQRLSTHQPVWNYLMSEVEYWKQ